MTTADQRVALLNHVGDQRVAISMQVNRIVDVASSSSAPAPVPSPPPTVGVAGSLDDAAATLVVIDALACPYTELAPIGRAVQQCRALLTARGAVFPSGLSFQIGISQIGEAGI